MVTPLNILKHAFNLFSNKNPTYRPTHGSSYGIRPDRSRFTRGSERTIVTSVCNRIAIDASAIDIKHVKLDKDGRYEEDINSALNNCFTIEANVDQAARAFFLDVVISMLDEGCVAVVPVETTFDPQVTNSYDILSMRTGKIVEWFPRDVTVRLYNDNTGVYEDITLPKSNIAIIENPLYAVMNEPNSTMQRLIRKLSLMDIIDEESSSGKLDLIIQLPYLVKSEAKKKQAEERRIQIEEQLKGSKYGIAYIDGTEHITQLNRSVDNNLMQQVEYLTNLLYSQLGITQGILDGTADENAMNNYYTRTVEPIVDAIVQEFIRKFLTKTARTQRQSIMYFRDPFKLIPVNQVSEMADKFTRNEILTSNEFRQIVGRKPSKDPAADELRNKNLSQSKVDIENRLTGSKNSDNDEKEEKSNE